MKEEGVNPDSETLDQIISTFYNLRDSNEQKSETNLKAVLDIVQQKEKMGFPLTDIDYWVQITVFDATNNWDQLVKTMEKIRKKNITLPNINLASYSALKGDILTCLELLNKREKEETTTQTEFIIAVYKHLLLFCIVDKTPEVLEQMSKEWIDFDEETYIAMIRLLAAHGKISEISRILKKIEEGNVGIDEFFYYRLESAMGGNRIVQEVLHQMKENFTGQTLRAYSVMFMLHSLLGQVQESLFLFEKMKSEKLTPGIEFYHFMIDGCIKNQDIHQAWEIVEIMKQNGVKPSEVTYKGVLVAGRDHGGEEVLKLVKLITENKIKVSWDAYGVISTNYAMLGQMDEAERFGEFLKKEGKFQELGEYYMGFLEHFKATRQSIKAMDIFTKMEKEGVSCDIRVYDLLIETLMESGQVGLAENLFQQMKWQEIAPVGRTYNNLLYGYLINNEFEKAAILLAEVRTKNIDIKLLEMWDFLSSAVNIITGMPAPLLISILHEIEEKLEMPIDVLDGPIIGNFILRNQVQESLDFIKKTKKRGEDGKILIGKWAFLSLVRGETKVALNVFQKAKKEGIHLDTRIFKKFDEYEKNGKVDFALDTFSKIPYNTAPLNRDMDEGNVYDIVMLTSVHSTFYELQYIENGDLEKLIELEKKNKIRGSISKKTLYSELVEIFVEKGREREEVSEMLKAILPSQN